MARRAGVSPTTAKRAIRTPELLAPDTLARVRKAIAELDYEPDQPAAALRRGQSRTIGLIVGNVVEPFLPNSYAARATPSGRAATRFWSQITSTTPATSSRQLKAFSGHRISDLILRSGYGAPNLEYLQRLQARGTAVIEVDYFFPGSPLATSCSTTKAACARVWPI